MSHTHDTHTPVTHIHTTSMTYPSDTHTDSNDTHTHTQSRGRLGLGWWGLGGGGVQDISQLRNWHFCKFFSFHYSNNVQS